MVKLKRVLSCLVVIALIALALNKISDVMQLKSSDYKYIPFFEHAEDFDVLFMGTSHVMNAVYPMELWNDYGITSYNFGGHNNQLATTYWVMKNSLDYAKPKVMVIDCLSLDGMQKTADNYSCVHQSLDTFPISKTKIDAVNDLLNDPEVDRKIKEGIVPENEKRTKLGLLWDFSVYHNRWEDGLDKEDFETAKTIEYGAETRVQIAAPDPIVKNPGGIWEEDTVGMVYLRKMIEECKEDNIEVLLMYLPYPVPLEKDWISANTVKELADEYNVNYINFMDEDVVDFAIDCYDAASHLNPSGAMKVTDFLGEYLRTHYDVVDHRSDEKYSHWNDDYQVYETSKNSRLSTINDLNTYLILLEDDNYGFVMDVGDSNIFADSITLYLLQSKGVDTTKIGSDTKYIIVCGKETEVINSAEITNGTIFGEFQFFFNDAGQYGVYKDSDELFVLDGETLAISSDSVVVNVFDIDDRSTVVNKSEFSMPEGTVIEDRYPNEYGVTILSSNALRKS